MSWKIRRIRPDEGLRALRLHALADAPEAFGLTLAREEAFPEEVWHERAIGGAAGRDRVTFIAEQDGRWVGLATGLAADPDGPETSGPMLIEPLSFGKFPKHSHCGESGVRSLKRDNATALRS